MKPKPFRTLGVLLGSVMAAASLAAAQRPAPQQPTEQQKLKERVDALESQLKEANAKADGAAMEKDYVERIQKEVTAYYEKAFNSLTMTVGIIGFLLTVGGTFGANRLIQNKLTELRDEFTKLLSVELQTLKDSNAAQMKELEDDVTTRMKKFESDITLRSDFNFDCNAAMALEANKQHSLAVFTFRRALTTYIRGKPRLFDEEAGAPTLFNLFFSLKGEDPDQFEQNAKKELANELYNKLTNEIARAALNHPEFAPLFRDRNATAPATPPAAAAATTPAAAPDATAGAPETAQELPPPAPNKDQAKKPH